MRSHQRPPRARPPYKFPKGFRKIVVDGVAYGWRMTVVGSHYFDDRRPRLHAGDAVVGRSAPDVLARMSSTIQCCLRRQKSPGFANEACRAAAVKFVHVTFHGAMHSHWEGFPPEEVFGLCDVHMETDVLTVDSHSRTTYLRSLDIGSTTVRCVSRSEAVDIRSRIRAADVRAKARAQFVRIMSNKCNQGITVEEWKVLLEDALGHHTVVAVLGS